MIGKKKKKKVHIEQTKNTVFLHFHLTSVTTFSQKHLISVVVGHSFLFYFDL